MITKENIENALNTATGRTDISVEKFIDGTGVLKIFFTSASHKDSVEKSLMKSIDVGGFGFSSISWSSDGMRASLKKEKSRNSPYRKFEELISKKEEYVQDDLGEILKDLRKAIFGYFKFQVGNAKVGYELASKQVSFSLTRTGNGKKLIKNSFEKVLVDLNGCGLNLQQSKKDMERSGSGFTPGQIIYVNSPEQQEAAVAFINFTKGGALIPSKAEEVIQESPKAEAIKEAVVMTETKGAEPEGQLHLSDAFTAWGIGEIQEDKDGELFSLRSRGAYGNVGLILVRAIANHYDAALEEGRLKDGVRDFDFTNVKVADVKFPLAALANPENRLDLLRGLIKKVPNGFGLRERLDQDFAAQRMVQATDLKQSQPGWAVSYMQLKTDGIILLYHTNTNAEVPMSHEEARENIGKLIHGLRTLGCVYQIDSSGKIPKVSVIADLSILSFIGSESLGGHSVPEGWLHKSIPESAETAEEQVAPAQVQIVAKLSEAPEPKDVVVQALDDFAAPMIRLIEEMGYVYKPEENGWISSEDVPQGKTISDFSTDELKAELLKKLDITQDSDKETFVVMMTPARAKAFATMMTDIKLNEI